MITELLSPAGNFEKLKTAFLYGADAVYLGAKKFGMRAAADNFDEDELREAFSYTHKLSKKAYLTLNTIPRDDEYTELESFLCTLAGWGDDIPDAVIAADPAVIALVKEKLPRSDIHISTQAGAVSARACAEWHKLGAKRVVLARELSLDEIKRIASEMAGTVETEVFVHGSMCVSFSGRCLLSEYFAHRDADRGMCTQPCRWNYTITEEKRPEGALPVEQNEKGTFIMSSKDMCMLEHIPELIEAGVSAFKIEGRMKSAYYNAVVTNAYRSAIDGYAEYGKSYMPDPVWKEELESVSHREYCTGFYYDSPSVSPQLCEKPGYIREKAYLAVAVGYDGGTGTAEFIQKNKLNAGDRVELISPGKPGREFRADVIYTGERDENGEFTSVYDSVPRPATPFRLKVPFPVHAGDILRSAEK